eukprot:Skav220269  [mRNA]  locus=scaffold3532:51793:53127:- [translate_table: standard]
MAYARGAQRMRQAAQRLQAPDVDKPLFVLELVVRTACTAFQHAWREVCAVTACSRQLKDICSEDHIWEQLFKLRWPPQATANSNVPTPEGYWRKAFLTRLRRVQTSFLARNMPSLVQKNRRRDGFPNLKKVYEALRMSFSLSVSQGSKSHNFFFNAEASIQLFESALCLRCTFSSPLRCPLNFHLRGRSSSVGKEEILLTSTLQTPGHWNETSNEGGCKFLRSPCGRFFLALWSDDTLAGMNVTIHYAQIFRSLLAESEAWGLLAGRPPVDDLDSCLGLHDYTVALSLRSAKLECFSNTFYKVHLFGLGSNKSGFGGAGYSVFQSKHSTQSPSSDIEPSPRIGTDCVAQHVAARRALGARHWWREMLSSVHTPKVVVNGSSCVDTSADQEQQLPSQVPRTAVEHRGPAAGGAEVPSCSLWSAGPTQLFPSAARGTGPSGRGRGG